MSSTIFNIYRRITTTLLRAQVHLQTDMCKRSEKVGRAQRAYDYNVNWVIRRTSVIMLFVRPTRGDCGRYMAICTRLPPFLCKYLSRTVRSVPSRSMRVSRRGNKSYWSCLDTVVCVLTYNARIAKLEASHLCYDALVMDGKTGVHGFPPVDFF